MEHFLCRIEVSAIVAFFLFSKIDIPSTSRHHCQIVNMYPLDLQQSCQQRATSLSRTRSTLSHTPHWELTQRNTLHSEKNKQLASQLQTERRWNTDHTAIPSSPPLQHKHPVHRFNWPNGNKNRQLQIKDLNRNYHQHGPSQTNDEHYRPLDPKTQLQHHITTHTIYRLLKPYYIFHSTTFATTFSPKNPITIQNSQIQWLRTF